MVKRFWRYSADFWIKRGPDCLIFCLIYNRGLGKRQLFNWKFHWSQRCLKFSNSIQPETKFRRLWNWWIWRKWIFSLSLYVSFKRRLEFNRNIFWCDRLSKWRNFMFMGRRQREFSMFDFDFNQWFLSIC